MNSVANLDQGKQRASIIELDDNVGNLKNSDKMTIGYNRMLSAEIAIDSCDRPTIQH